MFGMQRSKPFLQKLSLAREKLIKRQFAKSCNGSNVESAVTLGKEMKHAAWRTLSKEDDLKAFQAQRQMQMTSL